MSIQVAYADQSQKVRRVVTHRRGSWTWQDAYATAYYTFRRARDGRYLWESTGQSQKYALTRGRAARVVQYGAGSLHNREVSRIGVDDFGTMFAVAE